MSMYGDSDPEDAYDAGDPAPMLLDVLEAVVMSLIGRPDNGRHELRRLDALRLVDLLAPRRNVDQARLAGIRSALERL